jgi:uncharacterized membrane protein
MSSPLATPHETASSHVERNVRAIATLEREAMADRTAADRLSDGITYVVGSAPFVIAHAGLFAGWIAINLGLVPAIAPFDPYPFSFLTLVVSLEAIFLSIFVLMSQNRMSRMADRRAHLDLQVDLLAEGELTVLLHLVQKLCAKQGIPLETVDPHPDDLLEKTDVTKLASNLDEKLPA